MKTPRNSKLNSLICIAIISATVALAGCGNGGGAQAKEADKSNVNAVPVEVATVAKNAVNASYNGTATLIADHEAQVASKATGVLMKVLVEEGMTVHEGQLLAELDNSNATAAVRKTEGCSDTGNNSTDFVVSPPNPRNSSSPANACPLISSPDSISPEAWPEPFARLLQIPRALSSIASIKPSQQEIVDHWCGPDVVFCLRI